MDVLKTIDLCLKGDRKAQKALYDTYKQKMYTLCMRYMGNNTEANDALQEGFIKIYRDLHQYKAEKGAFHSWMTRVFVNTNLELIRKKRMKIVEFENNDYLLDGIRPQAYSNLGQEEIVNMIQKLPDGYRTVFNLYIVEGYSHQEIANMLGISLSTSKSQLFKAKRALKLSLENVLVH